MDKLLELLEKLVRAIFGPGNEAETTPDAPATAPEQVNTPPGWEGDPPYRYIDVSRYQGKITLDGWLKVKAAGYKGVMLKTVSTNYKLSKRADGLYIDPTFETNYRNARAPGWTWASTTTPTPPAKQWPMQSLPLCGKRYAAKRSPCPCAWTWRKTSSSP